MSYEHELEHCVCQMARLGLKAESKDVEIFVRGLVRRYHLSSPELASGLCSMLEMFPTQLKGSTAESPRAAMPAMTKLMAYAVFCPPGHELDYRIFAEPLEARETAEEYETEVIPLYSRESAPAPTGK